MNSFQTTTASAKKSSSSDEAKPGFRTKTISTRLTPDELAEVESAAERAGKRAPCSRMRSLFRSDM